MDYLASFLSSGLNFSSRLDRVNVPSWDLLELCPFLFDSLLGFGNAHGFGERYGFVDHGKEVLA